jgi:biotin synthase-related radical SAM superfamily protein
MGETEQEILEVAQKIRDMGGHNHMFAFFPERGSLMEDCEPVSHDWWRRVQLARFLIDYAGGHVSRMRFDASGHLSDIGMDRNALKALVDSGRPFQTSGCPGHK